MPAARDAFPAIDDAIRAMPQGNIAFNTPPQMNLGDTATIDLLLSPKETVTALKQQLQQTGGLSTDRVAVSDRMGAKLSGTNFWITAASDPIQAVSDVSPTKWEWQVKPKAAGRAQPLDLTISVYLTVDGTSTPRDLQVYHHQIDVDVSPSSRISQFVADNWQWLWATLVVPIAGWLWHRYGGKPKKAA